MSKHLHKYRLKNLSRKKGVDPYYVYICIKQDCSHNIRVDLVDGKAAQCNRCDEPFIMRLIKLKHGDRITVRPHCEECTKTPQRIKQKKEKLEQSIEDLMDSIIPKGM